MRNRSFVFLATLCALAVVGCRNDVKDSTPYQNISGLAFEVDDGTGVFYSKTKAYMPVYCGTEYPIRPMDIGQDNLMRLPVW